MTRGIYTNWIIGGISLLLIIAAACYLWYQHQTSQHRKQAAETNILLQRWKNNKEKSTRTPAQSTTPTPEKPITDPNGAQKDISTNEITKTYTTAAEETDNPVALRVSPYGLGEFPEIPAYSDLPQNWFDYDHGSKNQELMARVMVKLWQEGRTPVGTRMSNGLVYVTFPNTLIVSWGTEENPILGTRRYAKSISWCPEAEGFQNQMKGKIIYEDDFPSRFKIVEHKNAGIDPHEYLDLPQ